MATTFGIIHRFKGGTIAQYESAQKLVHPDGGRGLPPGQTYHAAGPTDDGIVVVALWDSEDSWVRFRDETLLPGLASIEDPFPEPPEETAFRVHNSQSA